ncbi:hypothetical protein ACLOJK_030575 [Asimina triloba]
MDATACRVNRPREDAAMEEWRERGRETNAADTRIRARARDLLPNPLLITTRDNLRSSSTVVVRLSPRRLLHFRSAVTISHHPPCSSSASGSAPFRACSPFPSGAPHHPRQTAPAIARLSSRSLPVFFSIPDHRLRFRRHVLHSRPDSPFPPLYSPLFCLRFRSLPPVFSHSDESHTSGGLARAAALALSLSLLRTSDYNSPKVPIPGLHLPMIW